MSEPNERDAKLVQYLNEAYGKEQELITALAVDIEVTTKAPYKKRLQQHLKETKRHSKALERRIKQLGGGKSALQAVVGKAVAAAKGPGHALRGGGIQEKMLKNAKSQYFNEHEEITTYLAIETFATKVGDKETAKLARDIRREEERMAKFLEGQVKALSGAVAIEEVPAAQRRSTKAKAKRSKAAKPVVKAAAKPAAKAAAKSNPKKASKKPAAKKSTAKKSSAKSSTKKSSAKKAKAKAKK
jgi:ferritin-like metal-binding protein YciE